MAKKHVICIDSDELSDARRRKLMTMLHKWHRYDNPLKKGDPRKRS
jgi:hypothetical protein